MSAFVVSDDVMRRVVRILCAVDHHGPIVGHTFAGVVIDGPAAASQIGRKLYALNIAAVRQRYSADTVDDGKDVAGITFTMERPSILLLTTDMVVDGYKAIECLIYQCSEGDVPETELFKELDRASDKIAAAIVRKLPAYDKAKWG